jgi:hypothetical protein
MPIIAVVIKFTKLTGMICICQDLKARGEILSQARRNPGNTKTPTRGKIDTRIAFSQHPLG